MEALKYASILTPSDVMLKALRVEAYLNVSDFKSAQAAMEPITYMPHLGSEARKDVNAILDLIVAQKRDEALAMVHDKLLKDLDDDA